MNLKDLFKLNYREKGKYRHELKYVLDVGKALKFLENILQYGFWDPHSVDGSYHIASLYYDTSSLRFYRDRQESVGYRRKVRLRGYVSNGKVEALFLEIKEKHRNFVKKKRVKVNIELLKNFSQHNAIPIEAVLQYAPDSEAKREVSYLHRYFKLAPTAIVRYKRKALIPQYEQSMRITLDTEITAGGAELSVQGENEAYLIPAHIGVLEVKTNQSIPLWLNHYLLALKISQVRYSKYCLSIDNYLLKDTPARFKSQALGSY